MSMLDLIKKAAAFAESDQGKADIAKAEAYLDGNQKPPTGATGQSSQDYQDGYNAALNDAITALRWWAEQQNYTDIADQNDWARVINDLRK